MTNADLPPEPSAILVTASRTPEEAERSAASTTVIGPDLLERLDPPDSESLLRLLPSTAVAASGPRGSQSQVRIRGAEANHTLLFVDGIRANDPAAGNEPRFELLNADLAARIEQVRGPQSALWGSEAIGGVIAVTGEPVRGSRATFDAERGAAGFGRLGAGGSLGDPSLGVAAAFSRQRSKGIDSFDGHGDRDGFANDAWRVLGRWQPASELTLEANGFAIAGRSEFDGYDPATFRRADTRDETRNRLAAGRAALDYAGTAWFGQLEGSELWSSNRNLADGAFLNRTRGARRTVAAQLGRRFAVAGLDQQLVVAADAESERFRADDASFGGLTDQDRRRSRQSVAAEWRVGSHVVGDLAVRHDRFSHFRDKTTLRASLLVPVGRSMSLQASYGEGIAAPTFFDLFGFFPGFFKGNAALKPESSRGFEVGARWHDRSRRLALTYYRQALRDEIVDVFDPETFLASTENGRGKSRRQGIEVEGAWRIANWSLMANYAWLDASEPTVGGSLREVRRARHSGAVAIAGSWRKLNVGASLAYSGRRIDTDFDRYPPQRVSLSPYWLASARLGWQARPFAELFVRASNAFDERYQDVVGYRTEGRALYGGVRLSAGR